MAELRGYIDALEQTAAQQLQTLRTKIDVDLESQVPELPPSAQGR